jgi:hypothetical protein
VCVKMNATGWGSSHDLWDKFCMDPSHESIEVLWIATSVIISLLRNTRLSLTCLPLHLPLLIHLLPDSIQLDLLQRKQRLEARSPQDGRRADGQCGRW